MMAIINRVNGYSIERSEKFFIDANIWLYMYCPIGDYDARAVQKYSDFYEKITNAGNEVYVCSSLISEVLNRYMRIEFQIAKEEDGINDYKRDFRNNSDYEDTINSIEALIKEKILDKCISINDQFESFDFEKVYLNKNLDFNDSLYCHIAIQNGLKIITHDKDLRNTDLPVEIITY